MGVNLCWMERTSRVSTTMGIISIMARTREEYAMREIQELGWSVQRHRWSTYRFHTVCGSDERVSDDEDKSMVKANF